MRYSASLRLKEHLKNNKIKLYSTLGAAPYKTKPSQQCEGFVVSGVSISSLGSPAAVHIDCDVVRLCAHLRPLPQLRPHPLSIAFGPAEKRLCPTE